MNSFKKTLTLFAFLILSFSAIHAQKESEEAKYYDKMKTTLSSLDIASSFQSFRLVAVNLEKIANNEKTKWIPYYHASYAYVMTAFYAKDKTTTEQWVNKAQEMLDLAKKLKPNDDEIATLQGYIYQARMLDKIGREGFEWAQKAVKEYDHARFMNKENPRPYYLIGQLLYALPPGYGQNIESACSHFSRAEQRYIDFIPKGEFSPNWGEKANMKLLSQCK